MAERSGPMSIQGLLNKVTSHSSQPASSQAWAMRHVAQFDQLQQARMGRWLSATSSTRAFNRVSSTQIALLEGKQALRGVRRGLLRAAGRIAVVVAIAIETHEIFGHVRDYQLGKVSKQEFVITLAHSGGGIAGAIGGAWAGAQIGAFGGPWAWSVGVTVGGVVGYFGGSYAGEFTAQAWYGSLDRNVRDRVSGWLKETPNPVGN